MNGLDFSNILQNNFRTDFWKRYDDVINCLSSEQRDFVSRQKNVIQAKNLMYQEFIDYLTHSDACFKLSICSWFYSNFTPSRTYSTVWNNKFCNLFATVLQ